MAIVVKNKIEVLKSVLNVKAFLKSPLVVCMHAGSKPVRCQCQLLPVKLGTTHANLKDNKEPQIHRTKQEICIENKCF